VGVVPRAGRALPIPCGEGVLAPSRSEPAEQLSTDPYLVAANGGIFSFGDARFYGSTGSLRLVAPINAMAVTSSGNGYWLAAADSGVFAFGDAGFHGSLDGRLLSAPVVGMTPADDGAGYWLVDAGGVAYPFGSAARAG
jgi:hypothetical protein